MSDCCGWWVANLQLGYLKAGILVLLQQKGLLRPVDTSWQSFPRVMGSHMPPATFPQPKLGDTADGWWRQWDFTRQQKPQESWDYGLCMFPASKSSTAPAPSFSSPFAGHCFQRPRCQCNLQRWCWVWPWFCWWHGPWGVSPVSGKGIQREILDSFCPSEEFPLTHGPSYQRWGWFSLWWNKKKMEENAELTEPTGWESHLLLFTCIHSL